MTRATLARLVAAMLVLTVVIAAVMLQFDWNGTAASAEADDIDTLLDVMIVLSSFVFAIVLVMLGYCVWRYRAKPGDESDGEPIHGNTRLEIAWTLIPTIIVLFGAVYSWIVLDDIEARADNPLRVNVTAQQFKWTFDYPDEGGGVTADELHVPTGRQLELHLQTLDVLHSFWVPEWRIKRDVVAQPGGEGQTEIDDVAYVTPDRPGTYSVVCTELCGLGHATMRAYAVVEKTEQSFDEWLSEQEPIPEQPGGGGESG
jgi:cytochrome c oxidase subunit 2